MPDSTTLALDEAVRHLRAQEAALDGFRSSAGVVLAAASVGSGFLAPVALEGRDGLPHLGWVAVVALVVTTLATLFVLRPIELTTTANAKTILGPSWSDLTPEETAETFVNFACGWSDKNDDRLKWHAIVMMAATLSTGVAIISWTLLLATR